jgi:RIO kinase 1
MKIPERLKPLVEDGLVDDVIRQLMSGKEATVYVVRCGDDVRCAKVYKEANQRSFRQSVYYTEGRKTKNSRQARAMEKGSKYGRKLQEQAWQSHEVDALYRLAAAGIRVPKPHNFYDVAFTPEDARKYHQTLLREVVRMLCAGIIHGDLSEFNILLASDGPVIIDLPQAVDAAGNNHAEEMLERDINNLRDYFGRFAPELLTTQYAKEMWDLFSHGNLTVETPLTGRFRESAKAVDLKTVMRVIDDVRKEEEAKRLRLAELGIK